MIATQFIWVEYGTEAAKTVIWKETSTTLQTTTIRVYIVTGTNNSISNTNLQKLQFGKAGECMFSDKRDFVVVDPTVEHIGNTGDQ